MSSRLSFEPTNRDVSEYQGEFISCSNLLCIVLHCILGAHPSLDFMIELQRKP
jgi:hypothetical protein